MLILFRDNNMYTFHWLFYDIRAISGWNQPINQVSEEFNAGCGSWDKHILLPWVQNQ